MKAGFIGAGKVGFSLGKLMADGGVTVTGYYSQHRESAQEAADFTRSRCYGSIEELVENSDTIWITVPDGKITEVFEIVKNCNINNKKICHCSGAMTSLEAFPGIEETGATGYSIHPLFPVSDKLTAYRELGDAFFCIEGCSAGLDEFREMLESLGCRVKMIDGSAKALYHGACVYASNLVCAVIHESLELLGQCGFTDEEARMALGKLAMSNLEHIFRDGTVAGLTGPLERGDAATISRHLEAVEDDELYRVLSKHLIPIAEKKNPDRSYDSIKNMLERTE